MGELRTQLLGVLVLAGLWVPGCAPNDATVRADQGLLARFQDEDPAVRQQAAIDAARKKDRKAVPLLVDRLTDSDTGVRFAAINALERITGTDRGYRYYRPEGERSAAVARWRQWLDSAYPAPAATGPATGPGKPAESRPGATTSRAKAGAAKGGAASVPAGGRT